MENSIDLLNALVLISNYVLIPSLSYGSQLALGALGAVSYTHLTLPTNREV